MSGKLGPKAGLIAIVVVGAVATLIAIAVPPKSTPRAFRERTGGAAVFVDGQLDHCKEYTVSVQVVGREATPEELDGMGDAIVEQLRADAVGAGGTPISGRCEDGLAMRVPIARCSLIPVEVETNVRDERTDRSSAVDVTVNARMNALYYNDAVLLDDELMRQCISVGGRWSEESGARHRARMR